MASQPLSGGFAAIFKIAVATLQPSVALHQHYNRHRLFARLCSCKTPYVSCVSMLLAAARLGCCYWVGPVLVPTGPLLADEMGLGARYQQLMFRLSLTLPGCQGACKKTLMGWLCLATTEWLQSIVIEICSRRSPPALPQKVCRSSALGWAARHHLSSSSASNLVVESLNRENFGEAMPMEDKRLKGS